MDESYQELITDLHSEGAIFRSLTGAEVEHFETRSGYKSVQAKWAADREAEGLIGVQDTIDHVAEIMRGFV